jgi:uncharacterized protein involved in exopolysaccharide biosynthesis
LVLAVFCVVFVPAVAWVWMTPASYEAELKLFVKRERIQATADAHRPEPVREATEFEVSSEIEVLRSRELLESVVERHGLADPKWPGSERERVATAVKRLEEGLRVGPIPKTNVISLRYANQDPAKAADVLNSLVALYLEKRTALQRNPEALEFFTEQVDQYAAELKEAQDALTEYMQRNEISLLDRQKEATLQRVGALEAELQEIGAQIEGAEKRVEILRQQGESQPKTVTSSSRSSVNTALIQYLKTTLIELQNQRTELLSRFQPDYRTVQEIDKKIADTQAALEREDRASVVDETESLNPLRQSIESEFFRTQSEIVSLRARQRDLQKKLAENHGRQRRLESVTTDHESLTRRVQMTEENYMLYQSRKEEARIANALDVQRFLHVSIFEPATPPALALERHRPVLAFLGLLLASFASLGAALLGDRQSRPVTGVMEIATLTGLPVLSTCGEPQLQHVSEGL